MRIHIRIHTLDTRGRERHTKESLRRGREEKRERERKRQIEREREKEKEEWK